MIYCTFESSFKVIKTIKIFMNASFYFFPSKERGKHLVNSIAWSCWGNPEVWWIQLLKASKASDESTSAPVDFVLFKLSINWDLDGF